MAKNSHTGSVIAPLYFGPGLDQAPGNILSGNLSTSDGAEVINVPRVSNPGDNRIVTNVDNDSNTFTCESNLTFDGTALEVTGEISASIGVSSSFFIGDGSRLTNVAGAHKRTFVNSDYSVTTTDYYIGVDSTSNIVKVTLPVATSMLDGQTIIVKDEGGSANANNITISGSAADTIDGQNQVVLESPHASIQLYCNGTTKYFIV